MTNHAAIIQPIEREQLLYERVAGQILNLIKDDTWATGDRLPTERELAEAFDVSRTVIREAIKFLEAQGWVRMTTGSGIYVQGPNSDLLSRSLETYLELSRSTKLPLQLMEIRCILEIEVAALAAQRATPAQIAQMQDFCQEMHQNTANKDVLAELDFQLHSLLAEATQNELFRVLLAPVTDQLHEALVMAWMGYGSRPVERVLQDHETIVGAIARGDAATARESMTAHMAYSKQVMTDLLAE